MMDVGLALTMRFWVPVMNESLQAIELYKRIGEVLMRVCVEGYLMKLWLVAGSGKIVHRIDIEITSFLFILKFILRAATICISVMGKFIFGSTI